MPLPYTVHKKNSKWIKDFNKRLKLKSLDENKEENLCGLGSRKDFLVVTEIPSTNGERKKLINYSSNRHHYKMKR